MNIGFVQFAPELGNLFSTISKLEYLTRDLQHVDLLVLPELCNSGYNFADFDQAWETSEACGESSFLTFLQSLSKRMNCHIVSGFNERDGDQLYNTAVLVGRGGLIGKYRKMHLFMNEKDFFQPGNSGLHVWEIPGGRVGMLICFDWVFPEVWRILALKGADIICHPSNLVLPGFAQRGIPGHAMVNRIFIVTANRTGTERGLTFTGNSMICDPRGETLARAGGEDETVRSAEIDVGEARNKLITPRNHVFGDRRPSDYSDLTQ